MIFRKLVYARLVALAAALLIAGCGEPVQDWPEPKPAFWQITAPSGELGWLFGTVHALPDGLKWRTPALTSAMDDSGVLLVEIADLGEPGSRALFDRLAQSPGLPSLSDRVPPESRADLSALMENKGTSEADFARIETWAAALMLSGDEAGDPANGVDRALIADAAKVRALETREGQLRIFDGLPESDQAELLLATLAESRADDPLAALRAWLTGDLAALERQADEGLLSHPHLREALLVSRNTAWLRRIEVAIAAGERPLVAVGAVHMLGVDGLPALLAARGYTVERLQ